MDIGAARAWLDAHVNLESTGLPPGADRRATAPTLDRIQALVELLGSPQDSYPEIHLTGTNGKTSVARMTSALLEASGLSVGVYTSPHLEEINERIAHMWSMKPSRCHIGTLPSPAPATSQPHDDWNSWSYPGQSARGPFGP